MSNNSTVVANETVTVGITNVTVPELSALEKWWNDYFFVVPILLSGLTFVCLMYYISVLRVNSQDYQMQQAASRRDVEASYARFCVRAQESKAVKERLRLMFPNLDALGAGGANLLSAVSASPPPSPSSEGMSTAKTSSPSSRGSHKASESPSDTSPSVTLSSQM